MSLSNKIIRCHILDRRDQLDEAKESQDYLAKELPKLEKAAEDCQGKLSAHLKRIEKLNKHIKYLESTMHIHWIDNPPY